MCLLAKKILSEIDKMDQDERFLYLFEDLVLVFVTGGYTGGDNCGLRWWAPQSWTWNEKTYWWIMSLFELMHWYRHLTSHGLREFLKIKSIEQHAHCYDSLLVIVVISGYLFAHSFVEDNPPRQSLTIRVSFALTHWNRSLWTILSFIKALLIS